MPWGGADALSLNVGGALGGEVLAEMGWLESHSTRGNSTQGGGSPTTPAVPKHKISSDTSDTKLNQLCYAFSLLEAGARTVAQARAGSSTSEAKPTWTCTGLDLALHDIFSSELRATNHATGKALPGQPTEHESNTIAALLRALPADKAAQHLAFAFMKAYAVYRASRRVASVNSTAEIDIMWTAAANAEAPFEGNAIATALAKLSPTEYVPILNELARLMHDVSEAQSLTFTYLIVQPDGDGWEPVAIPFPEKPNTQVAVSPRYGKHMPSHILLAMAATKSPAKWLDEATEIPALLLLGDVNHVAIDLLGIVSTGRAHSYADAASFLRIYHDNRPAGWQAPQLEPAFVETIATGDRRQPPLLWIPSAAITVLKSMEIMHSRIKNDVANNVPYDGLYRLDSLAIDAPSNIFRALDETTANSILFSILAPLSGKSSSGIGQALFAFAHPSSRAKGPTVPGPYKWSISDNSPAPLPTALVQRGMTASFIEQLAIPINANNPSPSVAPDASFLTFHRVATMVRDNTGHGASGPHECQDHVNDPCSFLYTDASAVAALYEDKCKPPNPANPAPKKGWQVPFDGGSGSTSCTTFETLIREFRGVDGYRCSHYSSAPITCTFGCDSGVCKSPPEPVSSGP